jgi:phage gp46-like protein
MDLQINWDNNSGQGEWAFDGAGDLAVGNDLTTAVLVSLFTDRFATSDFQPWDKSGNHRGFWGNSYETSEIGSSLWQLERSKFTDNVNLLLAARDYVKQSLQWMIDDGIAASISVVTSRQGTYGIGIAIVITKPVTNLKIAFQYSSYWNQVIGG